MFFKQFLNNKNHFTTLLHFIEKLVFLFYPKYTKSQLSFLKEDVDDIYTSIIKSFNKFNFELKIYIRIKALNKITLFYFLLVLHKSKLKTKCPTKLKTRAQNHVFFWVTIVMHNYPDKSKIKIFLRGKNINKSIFLHQIGNVILNKKKYFI